jgi:hypothetical protein
MAVLELLHFKAVLTPTKPTADLVDLTAVAGSGLKDVHTQRAAFVQWRRVRRVNWSQTFRRRGLHAEDYTDAGHAGLGRYAFKRRDALGPAAEEIFTRDFACDALLQGEVLTFFGESPCVPVELVAATRGELRWFTRRKTQRFAEHEWVVERSAARELRAMFLRSRTRSIVDQEFLTPWDEARSIIRICTF